MTTPAKRKLTIYQGASFIRVWRLRDKKTKQPIDLTGCKVRMQFRSEVESDVVLLELTTENGRIAAPGPEGEIKCVVMPVDTAAIAWESAVWDQEIEFPDGLVWRTFMGTAAVSPEVTRG